MLNETKSNHIRKQIIAKIREGPNDCRGVIEFQIARRDDTASGLERQLKKEHEEIEYIRSLDEKELQKEADE